MRLRVRYLYFGLVSVVGFAGVLLAFSSLGGLSLFIGTRRVIPIRLLPNTHYDVVQFNQDGHNIYSNGNLPAVGVSTNKSEIKKPLVLVTAEEFRTKPGLLTGNLLIDDYGKNDMGRAGENGRGLTFTGKEKKLVETHMNGLRINVLASDIIPLNRIVPDSRPIGCSDIEYPIHDLPTASIIVPFYNEWPSILLRTVYSIINRSPRHLIKEIVLVDDASDTEGVKAPLDKYIDEHFPKGLVKLIHLKERIGLIKGRLIGLKHTTSDVIIFFDCHMEVNVDWLPPLLMEVKKDRRTVAMGTLDYINAESFHYKFYEDYMTRYGFDWRLVFFETFWRDKQIHGKSPAEPRIGAVMVGAAFAIDSKYFAEIGQYDEGMNVWGGENLEMAWRVWMCGGRLIHLPCSHIGHIARSQPYSFPGGRAEVEAHNYKRAIEVWMPDNYKKIVYDNFENMKNMDVGDLTERIKIKERLKCKNFTWFIDNVWPELNVLDRDALAWGSVRNPSSGLCLDTNQHLFNYQDKLTAKPCTHKYSNQGFNLDKGRRLRSSLHCAGVNDGDVSVKLDDCIQGLQDFWTHKKDGPIVHKKTSKCLELNTDQELVLNTCIPNSEAQKWTFQLYVV